MFEHANLTAEAYQGFLEEHNEDEAAAFASLVTPIVERFCTKNELPPIDSDLVDEFSAALWAIAQEEGISRPLSKKEKGEPVSLEPEVKAELITELLDRIETSEARFALAHMGKYFFSTMLQPEFADCRLNYCTANEEGEYRRQNLDYCKKRISGSHCVDCPLFIQTEPENHPQILQLQWKAIDDSELHENLDVFLPEDFRQFRYFMHLYRRCAAGFEEVEEAPPADEAIAETEAESETPEGTGVDETGFEDIGADEVAVDETGFEDIGIEDDMDFGDEDWG